MFENNHEALYKAFCRALMKGNAYAYKELADRANGKLKEIHQHEIHPYKDMPEKDILKRIAELQQMLGVTVSRPQVLPSADDDSETRPN